ncbi:galactoside 2-alpha-L-fucosyltransferase-like [Vicia villosa]|uniref:galactoside 2-alpha-L-fucosyltransferase-like n=1 Tax=Vicia villosa TaxID=3911 RepID=UPI00273A9ABF|nr:galactoside 2-alpha-L-fucosyltransferase-like [Vicia villosa]XP_058788372.1 galactoside 2-alpha-L-fucosyltransferase-like [Vicia villosa]
MQEAIHHPTINMKRILSRNHDGEELIPDSHTRSPSISNRKCSVATSIPLFASLALITLSLFSLSFILPHSPSTTSTSTFQHQGLNSDASDSVKFIKDKLLGGLLAAGFDDGSCLSRYHSIKGLSGNPSSYLISRLRKYEALHKKCGPYTESYNKTVKDLSSGHLSESPDCKYVVWISFSGLGNRILTLASAFLYALLTNRVLLVDPGVDMVDLFCEPIPDVSWFIPPDFPLNSQFHALNQKSDQCHGKMLKDKSVTNSKVPSSVYLHLVHDYSDEDKLFFCDEEQKFLQKVPWLIMKTDNYFIPSLFLMSSFDRELSDLFPNKEKVFHFLGRYLFHPKNKVWGFVTRYYESYLANVDERVGIQIRVFDTRPGPFQYVLDQILACTMKENLLPDVDKKHDITGSLGRSKSKAILMTSLSSGYFEKIRDMYWEYPTLTGEVISVYQPSHEGYQQTEKQIHNQKAWAEMYLLSLTDVLVTSSWSTFGYVAQGLGGLKPWILYKPENETAPDPPCRRAISMEPCFHAPPFYDCKAKRGTDTGAVVPHVRHCEDMSWGLKIVDN